MIFNLWKECGEFAENKDKARDIRERIKNHFMISGNGDAVVFDFSNIDSTTQSFIHALISEFFQKYGENALEIFEFKNCNTVVQSIITTVINYSLE